jgi:hypothetical protein
MIFPGHRSPSFAIFEPPIPLGDVTVTMALSPRILISTRSSALRAVTRNGGCGPSVRPVSAISTIRHARVMPGIFTFASRMSRSSHSSESASRCRSSPSNRKLAPDLPNDHTAHNRRDHGPRPRNRTAMEYAMSTPGRATAASFQSSASRSRRGVPWHPPPCAERRWSRP